MFSVHFLVIGAIEWYHLTLRIECSELRMWLGCGAMDLGSGQFPVACHDAFSH